MIVISIFVIGIIQMGYVNAQNKIECVNSKNNYLYAGVDNEIKISVINETDYERFLITTSNGEIYKDTTNYNCIPRRSGRAKISVKGIKSTSDTINILTKNFLVYTIPPVKLTIGGKTVDELARIEKRFLLENDVFGIHLSDDIINCNGWVNIEKVTMGYLSRGGFYERNEFAGNKLPEELKKIIASLPSGKELSFEVRLSFTGNVQKNLPVFVTRIY